MTKIHNQLTNYNKYNIHKNAISDNDKSTLFNNRILWTIDDLMKVTGLARQTIYNKVSQGAIPKRKRWGKLYFIPDEIINMIEEGEIDE